MKKGFKVLRNGHSCIVGHGGCNYEEGIATRPNPGNGPLCVFNNKANAERFIAIFGNWQNFTIVPCKYVPSKETRVWVNGFEYDTWRSLKSLPSGTRLADSVTCLA